MGYTFRPEGGGKVACRGGNILSWSMASLCREFGIACKTGYKIFARYEQCGWEGLSDRTRRPFRYANQLPEPVEAAILTAKRDKPHWGARKIHERLLRRLPHAVKSPRLRPFMPCWIGMTW
jgi:hypothetical protein